MREPQIQIPLSLYKLIENYIRGYDILSDEERAKYRKMILYGLDGKEAAKKRRQEYMAKKLTAEIQS